MRKLEALGLLKVDGQRTGGRGLTTRYCVVLPPPAIDRKATVIVAKERKGTTHGSPLRSARTEDAPSEVQPSNVETEKPKPNIKLVSFPSQTAPTNQNFGPQTRLYAKLYRKLSTDQWPELTDTMLSQFDELEQAAKKQTLDEFLRQEQIQAPTGEIPGAPSSGWTSPADLAARGESRSY